MSEVPTLTVSANGAGVVLDSLLNTFVQGGALVADLQGFTGVSNMTVQLIGTAAPGDAGAGQFYWNASSTATDDGGASVVAVNGVLTGRWLRLPSSGSASQWTAGTVTAVGANLSINAGTISAAGSVGVTTVVAATGLAGGTITGTGTISLGTIGAGLLFGNPGSVAAVGQGITIGAGLTLTGTTLSAPSSQWNAGAVNALAGGLSVTAGTLSPATSWLAVGAYAVAQFHVNAIPTEGSTYAGSTLYSYQTGTSLGATGTWQFKGTTYPFFAGVCCIPPLYAVGLWLRVA